MRRCSTQGESKNMLQSMKWIFYSFFLHLSLILLLNLFDGSHFEQKPKDSPTEITLNVQNAPNPKNLISQNSQTSQINNDQEKKSHHLSDKTLRVSHETQKKSLFTSVQSELIKDILQNENLSRNSKKPLVEKNNNSIKTPPIRPQNNTKDEVLLFPNDKNNNSYNRNSMKMNSQLQNNNLWVGDKKYDNIQFGEITSLNSDEFQFYSFYRRVVELTLGRWLERVDNAVFLNRDFFYKTLNEDKIWVTEIEFWLNENGDFHSAHILKESGSRDFDWAAVDAFRDARHFPHPFKELIQQDGFIKLNYKFKVITHRPSLSERN